MDQHLYICQYCGKEYEPKRRHKQKFCRASCRVNAFNQKKKLTKNDDTISKTKDKIQSNQSINMAGIGNAAIANVAYDLTKGLFTSKENKPVTKKDFDELISKIDQRYFPVRNAPAKNNGTYAFYDRKTETVTYLPVKQNGNK